jgi:hypothetical protein
MPKFITPEEIFDEFGSRMPNSDEMMECETFERREQTQKS